MEAGTTFTLEPFDKHLWVVLSDPKKDPGNVLIVNLTTFSSTKGWSIADKEVALATDRVEQAALPDRAAADALHIAIAAVNGIEYLLTWNCTHIANAELRGRIEAVCRERGFEPPMICTPEELLQERADGDG